MTFQKRFITIIALLLGTLVAVCAAFVWLTHEANRKLHRSHLAHESYHAALKLSKTVSDYGRGLYSLLPEDEGIPLYQKEAGAHCLALLNEMATKNQGEITFVEDDEEDAQEEARQSAKIKAIAGAFTRLSAKVHEAAEARARADSTRVKALVRDAATIFDGELALGINEYQAEEEQEVVEAARSAEAHSTSVRWLVIGIGLLAVATVIAAIMTLSVLRAMRERLEVLASGTRELGRGNLGFRLKPTGSDELASLAADFDRMAVQVEDLHTELDKRSQRIEQAYGFQKEFFAMMTHELRAPLNSILGFCELIREDDPPATPVGKQNLQWVETNANRMLERVNFILTLAKLEAGKLEISITPFEVRPVASSAVEELKAQIKALGRTIDVSLEVAEDAPAILRSDEEKVRLILTNLVSNAAKFTEQGSIRVRVERASLDRVSVSVSDTGVGIPENRLERIFELYTVGERRGSGTGIGLALARRFARLLGGELVVTSAPGAGSTFTLVLGDAPEPSKEESDGTDPDR